MGSDYSIQIVYCKIMIMEIEEFFGALPFHDMALNMEEA